MKKTEKMTKHKYFTNQELLKELEKRLPEFTEEEFSTPLKTIAPYHQKVMKFIQVVSPRAYHSVQEKLQEWEQENTDKATEELKKSLENKKKQ